MKGGIALAPLITQMKVDIKTFRSDMDRIKTEAVGRAKEVSKSMESVAKVGEKMSDIGGAMTKRVTLPIVAAGAAAVKFGTDFGDSIAKVSTIADTTKVPIEDLKSGVMDLSHETGMAATELNEALYEAISGSVDTADAIDFLGTTVKAAKGGFTDTATAVDGLTTVLNSYGMQSSEAEKIANQMLITQNKGKTTFGELASAVGKVTPIAAQLGITTEELFSSLASTTAQGLATSESVTALKAAMSNIIKPSKEASEAAEQLGIDFSVSALQSKGWIGFLKDVKLGLENASPEFKRLQDNLSKNVYKLLELEKQGKKNTEEYKNLKKETNILSKQFETLAQAADSPIGAMASVFGSVEGLNSILMLTSENGMKIYNDTIKEMETNTTALDDAFNKMDKAPGTEMRKALNDIKNLGIELGDILMPVVKDVVEGTRNFAEGFKNLSPWMKETIVKTAIFSATLGPVISGVGKTITLFTKLKPVVSGLSVVFGEGTPLVGKFLGKLGLAKTVGATASTALSGVGTAAGTAAGASGLGALVGGLGSAALAAAPWVAAAGAVAYGGYKIYENLKEEVVPEIDIFADRIEKTSVTVNEFGEMTNETAVKISDSTKEAVGAYLEMDEEVGKALYDMKLKNEDTTSDIKQKIVDNFTLAALQAKDLSQDIKDGYVNELFGMIQGTDRVTTEMVNTMEARLRDMLSKTNSLTQEQKDVIVGNFRQTWDESGIVTQERMDLMVEKYRTMNNQIITASQERFYKELEDTKQFFIQNGALTTEEQAAAITRLEAYHYTEINNINANQAKIEDIYWTALNENRSIKAEEFRQIEELQREKKQKAVEILSEEEAEAIVINERLKAETGRITAEMASDTVKKANETRDGAIKAAETRYDGEIKEAARLKAAGIITEEQYRAMVTSAENARDDSVEAAKATNEGIKKKIEEDSPGIWGVVDKQTGGVLSRWKKLARDVKNEFDWIMGIISSIPLISPPKLPSKTPPQIPQFAVGTNYVPKTGLALIHEGEAIVPKKNNPFNPNADSPFLGGGEGRGINVTNNFHGKVESPYEVYKATKKAMRSLSFT